jgi:hypothetical protein
MTQTLLMDVFEVTYHRDAFMSFLLNIYPTIVAIPMGIATIVGYIFSGNAKAFLVCTSFK